MSPPPRRQEFVRNARALGCSVCSMPVVVLRNSQERPRNILKTICLMDSLMGRKGYTKREDEEGREIEHRFPASLSMGIPVFPWKHLRSFDFIYDKSRGWKLFRVMNKCKVGGKCMLKIGNPRK